MSREEEILKDHYFRLLNACEEDWQEGSQDEMHKIILEAMQQYAKEMSIGFAEYCEKNDMVFYGDYWVHINDQHRKNEINSEQLYDNYLKTKKDPE